MTKKYNALLALGLDDIGDSSVETDPIFSASEAANFAAGDKNKLDGIESNANNYIHPETHSADIIVDGTTNKAYTATDKSKLDGIASGAEVNVNADWNAGSGDAQILNKPTIPDAATDANITLTDITTNDVSTSKHGFAPKAPNDTSKFLRGDGTWAAPAGGPGSSMTIQEIDGSPTGTPATLKVTNGTLTDNGDTSFTLTIPNDVDGGGFNDTYVNTATVDGGAF